MYQLAKTNLTQIHNIEPIVLRSLIGEWGIDLAACVMGTRCNDMRPYLESELVYSASKSGSDVPDRRTAGPPDRRIAVCSMRSRTDSALATNALLLTISRLRPGNMGKVHSDQDSQSAGAIRAAFWASII